MEAAWLQITAKGKIVSKRKEFKSSAAWAKFYDKMVEAGTFYRLIGFRD